jgi:hypothetical protein
MFVHGFGYRDIEGIAVQAEPVFPDTERSVRAYIVQDRVLVDSCQRLRGLTLRSASA